MICGLGNQVNLAFQLIQSDINSMQKMPLFELR